MATNQDILLRAFKAATCDDDTKTTVAFPEKWTIEGEVG